MIFNKFRPSKRDLVYHANAHFNPDEEILIKAAARMSGATVSEFMREAVIDRAMIAVDTYCKHKVAVAKGVSLYNVDPRTGAYIE